MKTTGQILRGILQVEQGEERLVLLFLLLSLVGGIPRVSTATAGNAIFIEAYGASGPSPSARGLPLP